MLKYFQNILDNLTRKLNKTWVDKGSEFCNDNDTEIYYTHNEGKSVVAERFIRTLKNKIHKHMRAVLKNVYIDKLDDIINEYISWNN